MVRNCRRSPSGDFSLRFGAFFFSTILSPGAARFAQKRPTRCGLRQAQLADVRRRFPNFLCQTFLSFGNPLQIFALPSD
jgi:hypothetical protein